MPKLCFTSLLPCFKVKFGVKVKGQSQLNISRSWSAFWRTARLCQVQQRAIEVITSLEVFLCVSVISGRMLTFNVSDTRVSVRLRCRLCTMIRCKMETPAWALELF